MSYRLENASPNFVAMIASPTELKTYFASLAADLGCSFEYGNSERILNRQLGELTYPLLWLEVPTMQLTREHGPLCRKFQSVFLCLNNREPDDYAGQDTALDDMHMLTERVLQRMQADSRTHPVPFVFDMAWATTEHKAKWSADDDWGWATEFELVGAACEEENCC